MTNVVAAPQVALLDASSGGERRSEESLADAAASSSRRMAVLLLVYGKQAITELIGAIRRAVKAAIGWLGRRHLLSPVHLASLLASLVRRILASTPAQAVMRVLAQLVSLRLVVAANDSREPGARVSARVSTAVALLFGTVRLRTHTSVQLAAPSLQPPPMPPDLVGGTLSSLANSHKNTHSLLGAGGDARGRCTVLQLPWTRQYDSAAVERSYHSQQQRHHHQQQQQRQRHDRVLRASVASSCPGGEPCEEVHLLCSVELKRAILGFLQGAGADRHDGGHQDYVMLPTGRLGGDSLRNSSSNSSTAGSSDCGDGADGDVSARRWQNGGHVQQESWLLRAAPSLSKGQGASSSPTCGARLTWDGGLRRPSHDAQSQNHLQQQSAPCAIGNGSSSSAAAASGRAPSLCDEDARAVVLSSAPSVRESCELFEGLSSIRDWPTGRDTSSSHHHQEEPPIGSTHRNTEAPVSLPHSSQQDSTQRTGLAATEQQPPAPEPSAAAAAAALYASAAPAGRMSPVAHHGARPGQRSSPGSNTMAAVGPSQGSSPGGGEAKERARKQLPPVPFALAAVSDPKSASPEQRVMRSNGLRALLGSDWAGAAEGRDLLG